MQDEVIYPLQLAASPGQVVAATECIIEHTCSTFPGISGGPGVDIHTPWLFVHTRADADFHRNNYDYSVHHPMFVKGYEKEVLYCQRCWPLRLICSRRRCCAACMRTCLPTSTSLQIEPSCVSWSSAAELLPLPL